MMACIGLGGGVVICGVPTDDQLRRRILWCSYEQRRQEMVVQFEAWYGPTVFCCGCGDVWSEGYRLSRPWQRGWRPSRVRRHRQLWDRATYGPPPPLDLETP